VTQRGVWSPYSKEEDEQFRKTVAFMYSMSFDAEDQWRRPPLSLVKATDVKKAGAREAPTKL
jgi:hypothetical protein